MTAAPVSGFTASAGYCVSATAQRDGMELIAVVLGSTTKDTRSAAASSLLNYGFATYTVLDVTPPQALPPVTVLLGEQETVQPVVANEGRILVEKSRIDQVETAVTLCQDVEAPVEPGQKLGELTVSIGGEKCQTISIVAAQEVKRLTVPGIFGGLLKEFFMAH